MPPKRNRCRKCGEYFPVTESRCPTCKTQVKPKSDRVSLRAAFITLAALGVVIAAVVLASFMINDGTFQKRTIDITAAGTNERCGSITIPAGYVIDEKKAAEGKVQVFPVRSFLQPRHDFTIQVGCVNWETGPVQTGLDEEFLRGLVIYNYAQVVDNVTGRPVDLAESDKSITFNGKQAATALLYYAPWNDYAEFYEYNVAVKVSETRAVLLQAVVLFPEWPGEKANIDKVFYSFKAAQ